MSAHFKQLYINSNQIQSNQTDPNQIWTGIKSTACAVH